MYSKWMKCRKHTGKLFHQRRQRTPDMGEKRVEGQRERELESKNLQHFNNR